MLHLSMKSKKQTEKKKRSTIAKNKSVTVQRESQDDPLWHCQDHLMSLEKQKQLVQTENWNVAWGQRNPNKSFSETNPTLNKDFEWNRKRIFYLYIMNPVLWFGWYNTEIQLKRNLKNAFHWPVDSLGRHQAVPVCWRFVQDVVEGGVLGSSPTWQPVPWEEPRGEKKSSERSHDSTPALGRPREAQMFPTL